MHPQLPITTHQSPPRPPHAFTLIELLVVMAIMVLLMAVSAPAIKSLTKSNGQAQAANMIRAALANARSIAISTHRQAGVVFFEETQTYSRPVNTNQTAIQLMVEDYDQSPTKYPPHVNNGFTVFVYYSTERQYLPAGIQVATLNDSAISTTGQENSSTATCRVILFDSNGQMFLRNGIASPDIGAGTPGTYPRAYGDWKITTKAGTLSIGVSSPGLLIYNKADYLAESFAANATGDTNRSNWLQKNSTLLIINAYTGNVIR